MCLRLQMNEKWAGWFALWGTLFAASGVGVRVLRRSPRGYYTFEKEKELEFLMTVLVLMMGRSIKEWGFDFRLDSVVQFMLFATTLRERIVKQVASIIVCPTEIGSPVVVVVCYKRLFKNLLRVRQRVVYDNTPFYRRSFYQYEV